MDVIYEITDTVTGLKYLGSKHDWQGPGTYFGSLGCRCKRLKKYDLQQKWKESVKNRPKTFTFDIIELFENISNKELIERELFYQKQRNVVKSLDYVNAGFAMYCGGLGGKPGMKSGVKGKTYEEIYGDRADEQRIKRLLKLRGKRPVEVGEKISKSLIGKIAWNKGLTKDNSVVSKYGKTSGNTRKGKSFTKYIFTNLETNETFDCIGRTNMTVLLKQYAIKNLVKIRIDLLFKNNKFEIFELNKINLKCYT